METIEIKFGAENETQIVSINLPKAGGFLPVLMALLKYAPQIFELVQKLLDEFKTRSPDVRTFPIKPE